MADIMVPPAGDNPNLASLQKLASNKAAFSVPWPSPSDPSKFKGVGLHLSFHSREAIRESDWPFYGPCAFDLGSSPEIEFAPVAGKDVWTQITTTHVGNSHEHLGISGGVGIGCSFCGASVTVNYDRDTYTSSNSVKISTRTRHVDSIVRFKTAPRLNDNALQLLRYSGPNAFRDLYGDFYISGYVIGAEAGVCFSSGSSHTDTRQAFSVTIEVHFLFFSVETTIDLGSFHDTNDTVSISISAFDTISNSSFRPKSDLTMAQFLAFRNDYQSKVGDIKGRVDQLKKQCSTKNVDDFIKRGLALELVLAPFEELNEYVTTKALWENAKKWQ